MATAALLLATLLCSLTAGFVLAFATVVMPGLGSLDDSDFFRAFQRIDGVIQNNQPLFMLMWVGSIVAVLAAMVLGFGPLAGLDRALLVAAGVTYLGGVQLPTLTINIPLNNQVQRLDLGTVDAAEVHAARVAFESRWNRWNSLRTGFACVSVALMLVLLTHA